ncbi:hypothetical protein GCM10027265_41970 [Jatrophihabitans fulvus]
MVTSPEVVPVVLSVLSVLVVVLVVSCCSGIVSPGYQGALVAELSNTLEAPRPGPETTVPVGRPPSESPR